MTKFTSTSAGSDAAEHALGQVAIALAPGSRGAHRAFKGPEDTSHSLAVPSALALLPRLRILHVLRAPVGGLFRHVLDLAEAQARAGHFVGVVCDATSGDKLTEPRLAALGAHLALGLLRVPMSRHIGPSDVFAYHAVRAHAQGLDVDVIHGHGAKGGAYSRLVGASLRRAGRKLASCYTPHGGSLNYDPATLQGRIYMGLEHQLGRWSDALIFESAYAAKRYRAHVGTPTCAMQVVPNGLAEADFDLAEPASDAADVLFIGELRPAKGIDTLIKALAVVARERSVRAVIVGGGPELEPLKQQAVAAGLGDAVAFPGPMPARAAFKLGRTLVVPSRAESFPYVVLEAGAAGIPLVSTNVGGIPEIVAGTRTQLLPPDDVEALAGALRATLADPPEAKARAMELREAIGRQFTISSMNSAILELYWGALARR